MFTNSIAPDPLVLGIKKVCSSLVSFTTHGRTMRRICTREQTFGSTEIILLLAFLSCISLPLEAGSKVQTAWDKNADFSKYHTYAWPDTLPTTTRPMVALEIKGSTDEQLKIKGFAIQPHHPDLIINFYGSVDSESSVPPADPTYTATGGTPLPGTTPWTNRSVGTVASVSKGALVIDIRDASTNHSVWRGIAKNTLEQKSSALQKQIHSVIAQMFQDFPPPKSSH